MNAMMEHIFAEHELVLSSFVVDELKEVVRRKFPAKEKVVDKLLLHMSYNLVYTPQEMDKTMFRIRDAKDYPVLYTAILEDVDILITGDKCVFRSNSARVSEQLGHPVGVIRPD